MMILEVLFMMVVLISFLDIHIGLGDICDGILVVKLENHNVVHHTLSIIPPVLPTLKGLESAVQSNLPIRIFFRPVI
jgi:hypothetical protein